ncbi:MAG TPA: hypothetical protein VIK18_25230, partial [Pirellulales bacterium]
MKYSLPSLWGPSAAAWVRARFAACVHTPAVTPAAALRWAMLAVALGAALIGSIQAEHGAPETHKLAAAKPAGGDAAQQVVHQAAERLKGYGSISCRMRCRGEIFGKRILGNGEYRQLTGASNRLRWDSKLQVGDSIVSVQQIADGKYLWVNWRRQPKAIISRVELARVMSAERKANLPATGPGPGPIGLSAIGGLPRLAASLERAFRFSRLNKTRLGDTPVFTVRGDWTPAMLTMLVPDQQAAVKAGRGINWEQVPEQVPDHVV